MNWRFYNFIQFSMLYFLIFPALRTEASAPSDSYVPEISAVLSSVSLPPPTTPAFTPLPL
jgi:hypothetical protein